MNYTVGCDIVFLPTFERSIQECGLSFLERIFDPCELNLAQSTQSLAGYFAIKESVIKALGTKVDWHVITISKLSSGKPVVTLSEPYAGYHCEVSVAHQGDYVIAMAVLEKNT
jgi:holo-[acyl-carrier protein] synthase